MSFDEDSLFLKLQTLTELQQVAFLLSLVERMFPNYVLFAKDYGLETESLRRSIDVIWDRLRCADTEVDLCTLATQCGEMAPNTEDYESILVSAALDTAAAVEHALQFTNDGDLRHIVAVARLAVESIDMYVQETEALSTRDPQRHDKIRDHPLMKREIQQQKEDLEYVSQLDSCRIDVFKTIESKWRDKGDSNLGIALART